MISSDVSSLARHAVGRPWQLKAGHFLIISSFLIAASAQAASNSVVNMSHYDLMRVDFVRMQQQGIVGVIHEATYPPYVRDDKYATRQGAATRAGLLWGAYHFANARDPIRQADHFLGTVRSAWANASESSRPTEILLVLDFEKNGHYPGGTMRVSQAIQFIERIRERTGKYPGLYTNEYRVRDVLNNRDVTSAQKRVLTRCWLWIANYHYEPRVTAPWSYWTLWQYTGDGKCDLPRRSYPISISNIRKAERNIFPSTRTALEEFWKSRSWNPAARLPADYHSPPPRIE